MKELFISNIDAGQRFDKFLIKCLPNASKSFIYKMLRKKNITLNGSKADGSEKINVNDSVRIFFSDETYDKFTAKTNDADTQGTQIHVKNSIKLDIIYEDKDILLINKPSGMLSQKAEKNDVSLVEHLTDYLVKSGCLSNDDLKTFHPGVANRLDRNTSGLIAAGKTIHGLQYLTENFRERTMHKYYLCIVSGRIIHRQLIDGYLLKNEHTNKVTIYKSTDNNIPDNSLPIKTEYIPICGNEHITLLKINLITGRAHQIRAHLAANAHPIIGDAKYGTIHINNKFKSAYNISSQMLHSFEIDIPDGKLHVYTPIPDEFIKVLKGEDLWEPGIPEACEALH